MVRGINKNWINYRLNQIVFIRGSHRTGDTRNSRFLSQKSVYDLQCDCCTFPIYPRVTEIFSSCQKLETCSRNLFISRRKKKIWNERKFQKLPESQLKSFVTMADFSFLRKIREGTSIEKRKLVGVATRGEEDSSLNYHSKVGAWLSTEHASHLNKYRIVIKGMVRSINQWVLFCISELLIYSIMCIMGR